MAGHRFHVFPWQMWGQWATPCARCAVCRVGIHYSWPEPLPHSPVHSLPGRGSPSQPPVGVRWPYPQRRLSRRGGEGTHAAVPRGPAVAGLSKDFQVLTLGETTEEPAAGRHRGWRASGQRAGQQMSGSRLLSQLWGRRPPTRPAKDGSCRDPGPRAGGLDKDWAKGVREAVSLHPVPPAALDRRAQGPQAGACVKPPCWAFSMLISTPPPSSHRGPLFRD